jgi:hypothetical protein
MGQEMDRGSASGPVRKAAVTYHNSFVCIYHTSSLLEDDGASYHPVSEFLEDLYSLTSTDAMIAIAIIVYGALFATGLRWFERWFERE